MVAIETIVSRGISDLSLKLDAIVERVAATNNRLEEMSSVVKHSAMILAKLHRDNQARPISSAAPQTPESYVTINYNNNSNNNDKLAANVSRKLGDSSPNQDATGGASSSSSSIVASSATRWFPGSKVPGQMRQQNNTSVEQFKSASSSWCRSKTSIVRPSSCRELRESGANCTGQYYVFVDGEITHVYCDMNMLSEDDGGGWTVVLRRINKSLAPNNATGNGRLDRRQNPNYMMDMVKSMQVNFSTSFENYKNGFGQLNDWAEFFVGLNLLEHFSTTANDDLQSQSNPTRTEMQIDLETDRLHKLHIKFDDFSIGNEQSSYKIRLGQCNQTKSICEPMSRLNGTKFQLKTEQDDSKKSGASWGWWRGTDDHSDDDATTSIKLDLTQPIGKSSNESVFNWHWPSWEFSNEPLSRVVMKVRRKKIANLVGAGN